MKSNNPNSATKWWPKIKDLPVPKPKTEFITMENHECLKWLDKGIPDEVLHKIKIIIEENFSYPVFIRTDLMSGKHSYKETCYVENENVLSKNIFRLVDEHFAPFMSHDNSLAAFMVRDYLNIKSKFKAFWGNLPVGVEVRHFIKNGEWEKGHYYWPKDSIIRPNKDNWEELVDEMIAEVREDFKKHKGLANLVGNAISGNWSIDFAKTEEGIWYLIDMARYEDSYMIEEQELYFD